MVQPTGASFRVASAASSASGRHKSPKILPASPSLLHSFTRALPVPLRSRQDTDAASFFWFRNPRVIAYLFNWAYYENALSLALLIFSLIMVGPCMY